MQCPMQDRIKKQGVVFSMLAGFLLCFGLSGPVAAEKGAQGKSKGQLKQEMQSLASSNATESRKSMQELTKQAQRLSSRLQEIQKGAFANNPELKEQQEDFNQLVKEKLNQNLAAEGVDKERMQEIVSQLKQGEAQKTEKEELMQEYQEEAKKFEKARKKTLKDEEIQEKRDKYYTNMVQAMEEEDPQAEDILKQLKLVQYKIQLRKRQQAMAADMGNRTAGGGNETEPGMGE